MKLMFVLSVFAIISNCSHKTCRNVDVSQGGYKLMFYSPILFEFEDFPHSYKSEFLKKYGDFYIDDIDILQDFDKFVLGETSLASRSISGEYYIVSLVKNGKAEYTGYLQLNRKLLFSSSTHNFDLVRLENYNQSFKKLYACNITTSTLADAKKIISMIDANGIFCFERANPYFSDLQNYNGSFRVSTSASYFTMYKDIDSTQQKIIEDFSTTGEKVSYSQLIIKGDDSVFIDILCESDISKNLPKQYSLVKPFSDSLKLDLVVLDITAAKLDQLVLENKINAVIVEK